MAQQREHLDNNTMTLFPCESLSSQLQNISATIYLLYPRHVGRGHALKAIEKAITRLERGECGKCIPREIVVANLVRKTQLFAKSPAGNKGSFTPHPATWFNRSSYLDDPNEWMVSDEILSPQQRRNARNHAALERIFKEPRVPVHGTGNIQQGINGKRNQSVEGVPRLLRGSGD